MYGLTGNGTRYSAETPVQSFKGTKFHPTQPSKSQPEKTSNRQALTVSASKQPLPTPATP
jgi:hypothetical protein